MKYKIKAPNESYTGVSASVGFVNGIGETDSEHLANWFEAHGYTVEGGESTEKPLSKMNKAELTAIAIERGIEIPEGSTNAEIVKLLESGE